MAPAPCPLIYHIQIRLGQHSKIFLPKQVSVSESLHQERGEGGPNALSEACLLINSLKSVSP